MKSLKQIIIEYAEARGGGLPLTAQEMCNAVVLWCQQYLNETSGESGVIVKEQEGKLVITLDKEYLEVYIKENILNVDTLSGLLQGSDTIVVDVSEDGDKIEFHIDYEVIQKLDRAVLTPMQAPEEPEVPVLGVNNAIEWAPVSSFIGGGGGTKLYAHDFSLGGNISYVNLICTREAPFADYEEFYNYYQTNKKNIISFSKLGAIIVSADIPPDPSLGVAVRYFEDSSIVEKGSTSHASLGDTVTAL